MTLLQTVLEKLIEFGATSDWEVKLYEDLVAVEGEELVLEIIADRRLNAEAYERWAPIFHEFVQVRRDRFPLPDSDTFSDIERTQYNLLRHRLNDSGNWHSVAVKNHLTVIHSIPVGVVALYDQFGSPQNGIAFVSDEELTAFLTEVYDKTSETSYGIFAWCMFVWRTIDTADTCIDLETQRQFPVSDGKDYWTLRFGEMFGPQHGGSQSELHVWNGHSVESLGHVSTETY